MEIVKHSINTEKAKFIFLTLFRILLVVAGIIAIFTQNWLILLQIILTAILTMLPSLAKKEFHIDFPTELEIVILFFIFCSMFLGEIRGFYDRFEWWDTMLHTTSGIVIGLIAISLVYLLNTYNKNIKLSPFFICLFAFSFSVMIGNIWEIFEYTMDQILGVNMQKSGLHDTMWDMIVALIGTLAVIIPAYLYMKTDKVFMRGMKLISTKKRPHNT